MLLSNKTSLLKPVYVLQKAKPAIALMFLVGFLLALICYFKITPQVALANGETNSSPENSEKMVAAVKKDLSHRLSINTDSISVEKIETVNWSNTGLGCPEPGVMYAQVITPGFLIELKAKNKLYEYHTDRKRLIVLCDSKNDLK